MSRATTSVGPAAANGTMILTGRSGYPGLCASAAAAKSPAQAASTRAIALVTLMDTPLALSGAVPGHPRLSCSRRQEDRWSRQAGPRPDGIGSPLGDRLMNERAECKRFLARPNVQT